MKLETEVTEVRQIDVVTVRILEPNKDVMVEVYYQDGKSATTVPVMQSGQPIPEFDTIKQAVKTILTAVGVTATEK